MALLTPEVSGAIADVTQINANWVLIEATFTDLGPYVISGLTPTIGSGLSVNVSSGVAVIGGHVVVAGTIVIGSLTPSTTNHLFLLQSGAGSANTTGTPPANSVKLGTCVTGASTVTSVSTARSSGRQLKVRGEDMVHGATGSGRSVNLSSWNATADDGFEVFGTLPGTAFDTSAMPILAPASSTRNVIQPTGAAIKPFIIKGFASQSANLFELQDSSANILGSVAPSGLPSLGVRDAVTNASSDALLINHNSSGTPAASFASRTGWRLDSTTTANRDAADLSVSWATATDASRKARAVLNVWDTAAREAIRAEASGSAAMLGFYGANAIAQQAQTVDFRTAMINLGLISSSSGATPLSLNGGNLTVNTASFSGVVGGSGTAFSFKRFALTFPSDADYTLAAGELDAVLIDVQAGVITAPRNIIVPATGSGFYYVINRNAQNVVLKTSGGTGITINTVRARVICFPSGVNAFALSPNQDYTT